MTDAGLLEVWKTPVVNLARRSTTHLQFCTLPCATGIHWNKHAVAAALPLWSRQFGVL